MLVLLDLYSNLNIIFVSTYSTYYYLNQIVS